MRQPGPWCTGPQCDCADRHALPDAEAMVAAVRRAAVRLFPERSPFDLIYLPRFRRVLAARYPAVRLAAWSAN